jgi:outer membrane protein OmpA-like peptidoglycan-associated protein
MPITSAKGLDPTNQEITALAQQIEHRVENPTVADIRGGMWDSLYKPLRLASVSARASAAAATAVTHGNSGAYGVPAATGALVPATPGATAMETDTSAPTPAGPSSAIRINFETGSTVVDEPTRGNVTKLAAALNDPAHPDQRYLFIGHADIRGIESSNVELSKHRAEAIREVVLMLQPSLKGRIDVTGRGSSEPLDPARTESAYRANRRLQVMPE